MTVRYRLRQPVTLSDGRTLRTVGDAQQFILSLPPREQLRLQWQSLASLLLSASYSANPTLIAIVSDRLLGAVASTPLGIVAKKPTAPSVRRGQSAGRTKGTRR
jgi:hypothetical protein